MLPSHTSGDKGVYVRQYQAEIGGEASRLCGQCVCSKENIPTYYNFGCKKPEICACVLCCKLPYSLNSAAFEIVFGLYNKKFHFDKLITSKPVEIPEFVDILFA